MLNWFGFFLYPRQEYSVASQGFFCFHSGGQSWDFLKNYPGFCPTACRSVLICEAENFHTSYNCLTFAGFPAHPQYSIHQTKPNRTTHPIVDMYTTYKIFPNRQSNPYHIRCSLKPPTGISHMQHLSHPLVTNQIHDRLILAPLQFDSVPPTGTEASYCTR